MEPGDLAGPRAGPQQNPVSVLKRFQQKYWRTRQTLIRVTGQRQDEHVVASDAELDAKLEVFHAVQRSCMELLKVVEQYQRRICSLSQEEAELGRFLRSQGSLDKSRAGKIMQATGKALCFSSQQRLALRPPLCRVYQEVETFRYRAISDTWLTVNRMEQSRTEYRGALLWMKDVSQELDPDTHKHMDNFRRVQAQVRSTKSSFDKLKGDVCQKVDMLGASRCNLLSHVLTTYQATLLHFWEKTSRNLSAINESFKTDPPKESKQRTRRGKTRRAQTPDGGAAEDTCQQLVSLENEDVNGRADQESEEVDTTSLLQEILDSLSLEGQDAPGAPGEPGGPGEPGEKEEFFLPPQLLDQSLSLHKSDWSVDPRPRLSGAEADGCPDSLRPPPKDLSAWLDLFADLDPLSNPDPPVGKTGSQQGAHNA